MAKSETETRQTPPEAFKHTKAQLLAAKRYSGKRDLISALLDDNGEYTIGETDALIEGYLKKGTVI